MPKDGRRDLFEKGLEGGGVYFKNCHCQGRGGGGGVQIPYVIILGGKVLIHHAFLIPPPGRNKRPAPLKFLYNILTIIFVTLLGTSGEKQG